MTGESPTTPVEPLVTGYSGRLSNLLAAGSLLIFLGRGALPPLLPAIIRGLNISPSQAGLGLTLLWGAYAASHYFGGRFSDELTRKTTLVASLGTVSLGFLLLVSVPAYGIFLLGLALIGLGHGVYMPSARGLVADLFIHRRSQALGIQVSATAVGNTVAAGLAIVVLAVTTWQMSFLPSFLGLTFIALLMHRWNDEPYELSRVEFGIVETWKRLFTSRRMMFTLISYTAFALVWQGSISFLPTFLHVDKGLSLTVGSTVYAFVYAVGMVVAPLAGNLGDRLPRTQITIGLLFVSTVGYVGLTVADSWIMISSGVLLFAVGLWGVPPTMQAVVLDSLPDETLGGDFGAFKTVYTGVGSLGPVYVGFVGQWASYTAAFAGFVVCLLLSLVSMTLVLWNEE